MAQKQLSRGARAGAHHGSGIVCSATNAPDVTLSPLTLQASHVSRRLGLAPIRAALVARLAFDGGRA